jgi:hypothetical protein
MGTIYEIICWTTGRRYVGHTTQTLKKRLRHHESDFKTGRGLSSSLVLEHNNYEIYEIEKVEDKSKLSEREYYYIQHSDCVNIIYNFFDRKAYDKIHNKEWREKNKEYKLEFDKKYRELNREQINKKQLEKIICECGLTITKCNKKRHEKSQQHLNWLATQS